MITLLHGDYIEASRNELNRLKREAVEKEIRQLDGQSIEATTLVQSLESTSLFGVDTLVVVERLFGKLGRQQKKIEELCRILLKATGDIVLWEDKEIGAAVIKNLGTPTIRVFKLPVLIFQFLDGIKPGQAKTLLDVFAKLTLAEAPELVFAMLVKRLRLLIQISDGVSPAGAAGWQLTRLTTQAKSFTMSELVRLYEDLGEAEYAVKSGQSPFSLKQLLEQWILTLNHDH